MTPHTATRTTFSIFSIVALVAALLSFAAGGTFGFFLAVAAIVCGAIGVLLSFSARTRGGLVSIFSVAAGFIGIGAALVKLLQGNW